MQPVGTLGMAQTIRRNLSLVLLASYRTTKTARKNICPSPFDRCVLIHFSFPSSFMLLHYNLLTYKIGLLPTAGNPCGFLKEYYYRYTEHDATLNHSVEQQRMCCKANCDLSRRDE
jgi:hypothetical protein